MASLPTEAEMDTAYKKYQDVAKGKGNVPASGKTLFRWKKNTFNHMSVGLDGADYLVFMKAVVAPFPRNTKRDKIYAFIDRNWLRMEAFLEYIKTRRENEEIETLQESSEPVLQGPTGGSEEDTPAKPFG